MNPKPSTKQKKQQAKTPYLVRLPRPTLVAKGALGLAGQTDRWSLVKIISWTKYGKTKGEVLRSLLYF